MLRFIPVILLAALMACNSKAPEASKKIVADTVASTWTPDGDLIFRESIFHHSKCKTVGPRGHCLSLL